ncbi:MAG: hypothetical protein KJ052_07320 [Candidatus Hydrogenedentes bacterium]|nr:hypothetical protein [Candidatus Hydrogenedentota bacterium]
MDGIDKMDKTVQTTLQIESRIAVRLGLGLLLLSCLAPVYAQTAEPIFADRCLYAPAHFGNSYEVMGEREMRAMLEEARHWGFNRYCDWFDTVDCADLFADSHFNMGKALWQRKKTNFLSAQALGLKCDLCITPNHVFLDQCLPDLRAVKGPRIFGQLVCPSIPEAREIILKNYDNIFKDLAASGVRLSALEACPYDYGGCACDPCKPWILTFAKLCLEIHAIAEKYHPGIEMRFVGWWWAEEEHRLFAEWADAEAPGWAKSIALHIPYGKTDVSDVPLPEGCERHAFIHIGYADQAEPRDIYGHLGPVIAPARLSETIAALKAHGVTGFMAYSEGVYEDVNKALLAGITSGHYETPDQVLNAYAKRYFAAEDAAASEWAAWLEQWARPFEVDAAQAGKDLASLSQNLPADDWRVRQWAIKAELLRLHGAVMAENEWTPTRVANAEAFWAAREELERRVYGLGPLRHILDKHFAPLPWAKSWAEYTAQSVSTMHEEQE